MNIRKTLVLTGFSGLLGLGTLAGCGNELDPQAGIVTEKEYQGSICYSVPFQSCTPEGWWVVVCKSDKCADFEIGREEYDKVKIGQYYARHN